MANQFLLFYSLLLLYALHAPVSTAPACFDVTNLISYNINLNVDSSIATFCQSTTNDEIYSFIEGSPKGKKKSREFNRKEVEFLTMRNEEVEFKVFRPDNMVWHISCSFSTVRLAQSFYNVMNRRRSEPPFLATADYLKSTSHTSNSQYLANCIVSIYCHYFDDRIVAVIKDDNERPVLVFQRRSIRNVKEDYERNEVNLEVNHFNQENHRYKIGCSGSEQVTYITSILRQIKNLNIDNLPVQRFMTPQIKQIISRIGRNE